MSLLPTALRGAIAAAALLAGLSAASAQTAPAFSPEQKSAIEGIVRDYLLKNPEVMVEVMGELERRQTAAQKQAQESALKTAQETLYASPHDIVLGNPKGDVTLVEFFDYNCGYCKRAAEDVQALIKADPKLKVVIKDFPVLGPGSVEAARVAVAAKPLLGAKAGEFHLKLLGTRGPIDGARALAVARDLGADAAKLRAAMESPEVSQVIAQTVELGDKLSLTGTPAWIIGDNVIFGAVGEERLRDAVKNVRSCGVTEC